MSINRFIGTGNLTRDAELRSMSNGDPVLEFGIAINDRVKNRQTDQWEDRPNFFDCTMYGNRAQSIANHMTKGKKVGIEGRLKWSQWEKDGQKRSRVTIVVNEIEFMSSYDRQQTPQASPQPVSDTTYSDDDIPF